ERARQDRTRIREPRAHYHAWQPSALICANLARVRPRRRCRGARMRVPSSPRAPALLTAALFAAGAAQVGAQPPPAAVEWADSAPLDAALPVDPAVRHGELENGLRYLIRENREPKNRAMLRFVVEAGSILEDEDQLGLAHVLEHMAFNGTESFEKHEIVAFMESLGRQLGPGVN